MGHRLVQRRTKPHYAAPQNDEIRRLELALALADRHGVEYATLALGGQIPAIREPKPVQNKVHTPKPEGRKLSKQKLVKEAWKEIRIAREAWKKDSSLQTPDNEAFAYCYNDRQLDLPDWVYEAVPITRRGTVTRMMAFEEEWEMFARILAQRAAQDSGSGG